MRKIKLNPWNQGKPEEENLVDLFENLIKTIPPNIAPKGMDKFRLFNRIKKAFKKARESKELILEESEYSYLKGLVEKDIPAVWTNIEGVTEEVEMFLEIKPN